MIIPIDRAAPTVHSNMTAMKATLLTECLLPRDARIPSDLALLNSVSPMAITAERLGCTTRWIQAGRADHIRGLIADTLFSVASR